MSVETDSNDSRAGASRAARAARAALADSARLEGAITDFFVSEDSRLTDRARAMLAHVLGGIVESVETDIRRRAARLLADRAAPGLAETMLTDGDPVLSRLTGSGLLRDNDLMAELIARVEQDLIAEALVAGGDAERPSLLARLADIADPVVAAAAKALLAAESRRRSANDGAGMTGTELPAELHHRLVWWVAAALRERLGTAASADIDRAIAEAALGNLAAHDEGDRLESAAERLVGVIDPQPDEWPALLAEAIADRRFAFYLALIGHAARIDYAAARRIALDPDGERLWLALRMIGLDRASIAQIGLALSEADPRRDIEAFADGLDAIAAISPEEARDALANLRLHRDFQSALGALAAR